MQISAGLVALVAGAGLVFAQSGSSSSSDGKGRPAIAAPPEAKPAPEAKPTPGDTPTPDDSQRAQGILLPGQIVVTGFSGTSVLPTVGDISARSAVRSDQTAINPDGATLRVFDVSGVTPARLGARQGAVEVMSVTARQIGQVFGVTMDDFALADGRPVPNIYVAATSAYGLHLVVPGPDGRPRRVFKGQPGATFMEGLFGSEPGGPGTIWKIDGVTGTVTPFADVRSANQPNSGPGLGNLTFDPASKQLFVSDLDTGLIHRFDLAGQDLGTFDHGVAGRPAAGLEALPDDPVDRADISSPGFDTADPATWGLTHPSRRTWGLAVFAGRLYYSVAEGPEVWSVEIKQDGSFGAARRELALDKGSEPFEISDIQFSAKGELFIAQRPPVSGAADFVSLVAPGSGRVLRFKLASAPGDGASPRWVPSAEEYAVGQRGEHRFTSGGIALNYAHKPEGGLDYERCEATLWTTGDSLAQATVLPEARVFKASTGGDDVSRFGLTGMIDGVQGMPIDLVRPANVPPQNARFVDFDGLYVDLGVRGHLGAVRALQKCKGGDAWQPKRPAGWWLPTYGTRPDLKLGADLQLEKRPVGVCVRGGICEFELRVFNKAKTPFVGPILIRDTMAAAGALLTATNPSPWSCTQAGPQVSCHRPSLLLDPGRSISVRLSFRVPAGWTEQRFENCAALNWLGSASPDVRIRTVAFELSRLGYYAGPSVTAMSPALEAAIKAYQRDAGIRETGVVDMGLVDLMFGKGAARNGDGDPTNDEDCGVHRLAAPVAAAKPPAPMKLLPATTILPRLAPPRPVIEQIVRSCPIGTMPRGGRCVRICAAGYSLIDGRCRPRCSGGRVYAGGSCVCPRGTSFNRGIWACVPQGSRCPSGLVSRDGSCVCPSPLRWSSARQACVPVLVECPAFFVRQFGTCVPIVKVGFCPIGYVRRAGHCQRVIDVGACPPGHNRRHGKCVLVFDPKRCPFGQVNRGGSCVSLIKVTHCPIGQVRRGSGCAPIFGGACPGGFARRGGRCAPIKIKVPGKILPRPPIKVLPKPPIKVLPKPPVKVVPKVPVKVKPILKTKPKIHPRILKRSKVTPRIIKRPKVSPRILKRQRVNPRILKRQKVTPRVLKRQRVTPRVLKRPTTRSRIRQRPTLKVRPRITPRRPVIRSMPKIRPRIAPRVFMRRR
ncbi:MAG: peptidoglycan-binding protein [Hyphomicrobiaceae bacterium]